MPVGTTLGLLRRSPAQTNTDAVTTSNKLLLANPHLYLHVKSDELIRLGAKRII